MMSLLYPIFKKEIKTYLTTPACYIVAGAFLAVAGFLYYSNIVMMLLFQGSAFTVQLWEYTINDIRLLVMVLVPYITMRTFAEERKQGTLELLHTAPLNDHAILLGKFCAAATIVLLIIGCTATYPVLYAIFHSLDWGPVLSGYAGLLLLALALAALGLFVSSLTENQIIAAGGTLGVSFLLWFLRIGSTSGGFLDDAASLVSLQKHFYGFHRGVIATRDVLFFIFFCIYFLLLTHVRLQQRTARRPGTYFIVATIMWSTVLAIGMAAAGKWNARFDVTPNKAHTLSRVTLDRFSKLKDNFMLTVACDSEDRYRFEDFLDLFRQASALFTYRIILLDKNPAAAQHASLEQQGSGFVEYKGKKIKIEKIHEQALVQALEELTVGDIKVVRIYSGISGKGDQQRSTAADADLHNAGYSLIFSEARKLETIPDETLLVVVRDLGADMSMEWLQGLGRYFEDGGNILMLVGEGSMPVVAQFLKKYNIELGDDIITGTGTSAFDFNPLMQVMFPNREHPAFARRVFPVVFFKARSVQVGTEFKEGYAWSILCQSGRGTWAESDQESIINNTATFESGRDIYGPVATGVTVEKKAGGSAGRRGGRLAVIGNSSFITDQYYSMLGNADLYLKTVEWLTSSRQVPTTAHEHKSRQQPRLVIMTPFEGGIFFGVLVIGEPLLVLLVGISIAVKRRIKN